MRLKNSIDYKRFPEPSRGDWTRFTILVLSATLLGPCSRLRKQLAVFVDRPRRKLAYVRGWAAETDMRAVRPGGCESKGCPDPRGRQEMPQAQRRGISSILTSSSRQTAAHRHPLWTYKTPHLVRQGPISGNGAPQPPAQRTEAASQCGCLTKSVIVDFIQGHLERSRGHFFCIDRRELFDFDLLL